MVVFINSQEFVRICSARSRTFLYSRRSVTGFQGSVYNVQEYATLHLVLRLRGIMQIFVKTSTGNHHTERGGLWHDENMHQIRLEMKV